MSKSDFHFVFCESMCVCLFSIILVYHQFKSVVCVRVCVVCELCVSLTCTCIVCVSWTSVEVCSINVCFYDIDLFVSVCVCTCICIHGFGAGLLLLEVADLCATICNRH